MKPRSKQRALRNASPRDEIHDGILVRLCHAIKEFEACVSLERQVWKSSDLDVVPVPLFVVAAETGGHVIGAFRNNDLVGFTMAVAGWRGRKPFLHSHMTAVMDSYRDRGVGRRLKFFQRQDAIARGISLIEWTFDPLIVKNAYFNFMCLGAIAQRYVPNAYGITTSPLHAGLPTDRLIAEWHLQSSRVRRMVAAKLPTPAFSSKAVRIPIVDGLEALRWNEPAEATRVQLRIRAQFMDLLAKGYAATAIASGKSGAEYILEPWKTS